MVHKYGPVACVAVGVILAVLYVNHTVLAQEQEMDPVFELRTYTSVDGRMPALLDRFSQGKRAMLGKNGMSVIGFWVPADSPLAGNTLIYLLKHNSLNAAKDSWDRFAGDPVWRTLRDKTAADGPLVSQVESVFMDPQTTVAAARQAEAPATTRRFDLSTFGDPRSRTAQAAAVTAPQAAEAQGMTPVFELRTYTAAEGRLQGLLARFKEDQSPVLGNSGARAVGFWVPIERPQSENTVMYLLQHKSLDAAKDSWSSGEAAAQGPLVSNVESVFMDPTDFSPTNF
ncbi:MAG: hypothetical protein CL477_04115 [Acidobacteria bacterium]|jgi:hypothetical protein|nr:hypothetical protein [Acidobacteriota bacterium]MDP7691283.1 NIPSNAP family protein [Vicinamibacterales bacterium]HJN43488.1 NIPSNAP family protein [Vicinamibacterales bacterium]|tara:strand:- start:2369 stop:3223 length:855 start_codon:yes stop_codon:yes gene_type:complete